MVYPHTTQNRVGCVGSRVRVKVLDISYPLFSGKVSGIRREGVALVIRGWGRVEGVGSPVPSE